MTKNPLDIIKTNQDSVTLKTVEPWYKDGLHFECTGCGGCCTGAPGAVWVTDEEITRIANFKEMERSTFLKKYVRVINGRYSLTEMPKNYDCVFLKNKKCAIYPVRPKQCRTFPWWINNLESEAAWREAAKHCEGINPNARLVPLDEIQQGLI